MSARLLRAAAASVLVVGAAASPGVGGTAQLMAGAVVAPNPHASPVAGNVGEVRAIAAGGFHTCAVTNRGGVDCWGGNFDGQVGDGTLADRRRPVRVSGLQSGVKGIVAGSVHTCALTNGGGVKCWGWNEHGRLGDGTTTIRVRPVPVSGHRSGVEAITAGRRHTCALTNDGAAECWGWNESGQLGDGTTNARWTPVAVSKLDSGVRMITAGYRHTCALTSGGGVECWGGNDYGQLGDGTMIDHWTPMGVPGLEGGVQAIAAGSVHTCALTSSGAVECWGRNEEGELGDGTSAEHHRPVAVAGLHGKVEAIDAGGYHTCALTTSGGVECWGWNLAGGLGDGTRKERHTPVLVSGLSTGARAISAGGFHTCALTSDRVLDCWGDNTGGEIGDGTTATRLTPVPVLELGIRAVRLTLRVRGRGKLAFAGGSCSKECRIDRAQGTKIVLTAQASKGWAFEQWRGACRGRGRRCTLRLLANAAATADFDPVRKRHDEKRQ